MSTERFIDQLYDRYLNRSADISGKNYWLREIDSRTMNASQVTQEFINSIEFTYKMGPIINLYYAALDRIPDVAGLSYWASARQQGLSLTKMSDIFLNSIEYQERYNTLTSDNTTFLHSLYQNVFDRAADGQGLSYWLGQLNAVGLSRASILTSFSNSIEFQSKNSGAIKSLLDYYGVLGIQPDQNTLNSVLSENDEALVTSLYANDLYTGEAVPYLIRKGVVMVEGVVKDATVFIDKNFNEELDKGEVSTTTDGAGRWDFRDDATYLGQVVAYGGIDSITGRPIDGKMVVKAGTFEISPRTDGNGEPGYIEGSGNGNGDGSNDTTAPVITSEGTANPITENSGAGQWVYTIGASDSTTLTYSLTGEDSDAFTIEPSTGKVFLTVDPDFETQSSYTFTIVVTDAGNNVTEKEVTLTIIDDTTESNDTTAPVVTSPGTANPIAENSGAGQWIYTIEATDSSSLTYSLDGEDSDAFTIEASTGKVFLTADPNFESQSSYSFTVVVTDAGNNVTEKEVTLAIIDDTTETGDTNAPVVTSSGTASPIVENSGAGQEVYTMVVTDDSPITYSLMGTDGSLFTIDSNSGVVTLTADPDFETKASYTFTVVATDNANNASEQDVSLAITNDPDDDTGGGDTTNPVITSGAIAPEINENTSAGQEIYTVIATDDSGSVTYSLAGSDSASFGINADSGIVTLTGSPDFETKPTYDFTVVATDPSGNFAEKAVSLAIVDEDEGSDREVVIFDLVNDKSSSANGVRSFDPSLEYNIYVVMPISPGNSAYDFTAPQMWQDAHNLSTANSSSDYIKFVYEDVGNGTDIQRTYGDTAVNPANQHMGHFNRIDAILQGDSMDVDNWKAGVQPELAPRTSLLYLDGRYIDYNGDDLVGGIAGDWSVILDLWTQEINTTSFSTFVIMDETVGVVGDVPGLQALYDAL